MKKQFLIPTYPELVEILAKTNVLWVAVFFKDGKHTWLPVDKKAYSTFIDLNSTLNVSRRFPCVVEIDGEDVYFHPRWDKLEEVDRTGETP